eukprot:COSAG01_NODE_160_length_23692_cov_9.703599_28_plen_199_part_00
MVIPAATVLAVGLQARRGWLDGLAPPYRRRGAHADRPAQGQGQGPGRSPPAATRQAAGSGLRPAAMVRSTARGLSSTTKGLSYGSSFFPNGTPAPQANFFKEYSRYTFKKSAPLSKEEGTPEIISRPAILFLKACHTTTHQRQIYYRVYSLSTLSRTRCRPQKGKGAEGGCWRARAGGRSCVVLIYYHYTGMGMLGER